MRAGPLSSNAVIDELNDKFVNTWILRQDVVRFAGDAAKGKDPRLPLPKVAPLPEPVDARLRAFAAEVYANYTYPVDSLLLDADGKFIAHFPASDLFTYQSPDQSYSQFLQKASKRK